MSARIVFERYAPRVAPLMTLPATSGLSALTSWSAVNRDVRFESSTTRRAPVA
jgi:hypothetical protein